jgi:phosphoribosylaminoimidazole-succinocarboxamide synthase
VRGYLAGSGFKEYRQTGVIYGTGLPPGLWEPERLPQPIFTPSTKAEGGAHDISISFDQMVEIVGDDLSNRLRDVSLALYEKGVEIAEQQGTIIADTKFEFGLIDDKLVLIDELLTPDSSRFWPKDKYTPGQSEPSFDKQFLRDYLEGVRWNKQAQAPKLPEEIVNKTAQKYHQALIRLTVADDAKENNNVLSLVSYR